MLSDQIGGDLLANSRHGLYEGIANFPSHEASGLQHSAEGKGILHPNVQYSEKDDTGERQTLAQCLKQLRGKKFRRSPQGRQLVADHQTSDAYANESDGG